MIKKRFEDYLFVKNNERSFLIDKDKNVYMFTIYDEDGIEYTHHRAKDCFIIHNAKMNLYKYTSIDGTKQNTVYNIDTKKEIKYFLV